MTEKEKEKEDKIDYCKSSIFDEGIVYDFLIITCFSPP